MKHFLDAVRGAVQTKNWYAALTTALTLPDIAAGIDGKSGGSRARYVAWFDDYLLKRNTAFVGPDGQQHVFLSGSDCYALRCAFLHQGDFDITAR